MDHTDDRSPLTLNTTLCFPVFSSVNNFMPLYIVASLILFNCVYVFTYLSNMHI